MRDPYTLQQAAACRMHLPSGDASGMQKWSDSLGGGAGEVGSPGFGGDDAVRVAMTMTALWRNLSVVVAFSEEPHRGPMEP